MVSLLGMALGVASLIVVLSVMNGFGDELRGRILGLVPHATVQARDGGLQNWQSLQSELVSRPDILAASPYLESKVLLESPRMVLGAQLLGVDVTHDTGAVGMGDFIDERQLGRLQEQRWGIVLGSLLARSLGVQAGDTVELTAPVLTHTPLGSLPRRKRFQVVDVFEVGAQLDSTHALVSLRDAQVLMGKRGKVDGIRLMFPDLYAAPALSAMLQSELPDDLKLQHWQQSHRNLFSAVRMEKTMVTLLLLSVVAVAAFNIISTLTMAVTEKRSDIAVLRTMGAGRGGIMAVFICQGMVLSGCGIAIGALSGCLLALRLPEITLFLESLLGVKLFDPRVYFISNLPARLDGGDVFMIVGLALVLGLVATLIPAWRAAQVQPAEILRYD